MEKSQETEMADIFRRFQPDVEKSSQLSGVKNPEGVVTRDLITEQDINDSYYSLRFRQVKYGTWKNEPGCMLVMDGEFHSPPGSKRHRFKTATICLDFGRASTREEQVEIIGIEPGILYGKRTTENHKWQWSIEYI